MAGDSASRSDNYVQSSCSCDGWHFTRPFQRFQHDSDGVSSCKVMCFFPRDFSFAIKVGNCNIWMYGWKFKILELLDFEKLTIEMQVREHWPMSGVENSTQDVVLTLRKNIEYSHKCFLGILNNSCGIYKYPTLVNASRKVPAQSNQVSKAGSLAEIFRWYYFGLKIVRSLSDSGLQISLRATRL